MRTLKSMSSWVSLKVNVDVQQIGVVSISEVFGLPSLPSPGGGGEAPTTSARRARAAPPGAAVASVRTRGEECLHTAVKRNRAEARARLEPLALRHISTHRFGIVRGAGSGLDHDPMLRDMGPRKGDAERGAASKGAL